MSEAPIHDALVAERRAAAFDRLLEAEDELRASEVIGALSDLRAALVDPWAKLLLEWLARRAARR